MGGGRGLINTKSQKFGIRKKHIFYGISIFESVAAYTKLDKCDRRIECFVSHLLAVILCKNPNFEENYSHFSGARFNLPKI